MKNATVELILPKPQSINQILIMEDISLGERIRTYEVEGLTAGDQWTKLCDGQSVGHKRIQKFNRTEVAKIRLRTTSSIAEPQIRKIEVFNVD